MMESEFDREVHRVVDPTANVRDLVDAVERRQDDLREMSAENLRREAALRALYEDKLASKESERLDAIRQRDNEQVANAAEVQRAAATTLASTVDRSAEAMRSSQAAAATTVAATLDAKINPILASIGDLQRFQFEAVGGKTQVTETQAKSGNTGLWIGLSASILFNMFMLVISVAGLFITSR